MTITCIDRFEYVHYHKASSCWSSENPVYVHIDIYYNQTALNSLSIIRPKLNTQLCRALHYIEYILSYIYRTRLSIGKGKPIKESAVNSSDPLFYFSFLWADDQVTHIRLCVGRLRRTFTRTVHRIWACRVTFQI